MEQRCQHAHPAFRGKKCMAIMRIRPQPIERDVEVQCFRCHQWTTFEKRGTESAILTGSMV